MSKVFLTVVEVADLIRVHPDTVRKKCRLGEMPGAQKVGKQYLIHKATFLDALGLHDVDDNPVDL